MNSATDGAPMDADAKCGGRRIAGLLLPGLLAVAVTLAGCASIQKTSVSSLPRTLRPATPPAMPKRPIAPGPEAGAGETVKVQDGEYAFSLFLPAGYQVPQTGEVVLTTHFHGATWFAIQEHLRRGLNNPLLVAQLGEGSSVYRRPFEDRARFGRLIAAVGNELKRRGASEATRVVAVEVSSFSAGYGAVREIVKSPEYVRIIRRLVLCDSLYASFEPGTKDRAAQEQIDPWLPYAQAAVRGEKTFVLTYSQVPTPTYASTAQCAAALVRSVGAPMISAVTRGSLPATLDPEFPLLYRSDVNGFHVWGYAGADAQAHMTHVRHLADVWRALDDAGMP